MSVSLRELENELERIKIEINELERIIQRYKACKTFLIKTAYINVLLNSDIDKLQTLKQIFDELIENLENRIMELQKKKENLEIAIKTER